MARTARTLASNEGKFLVAATTGAGKAGIANHGVTVITSGANTWVMDAPVEGCLKTLVSVGISSAARVVRASTGTSVKIGNQGHTQITFNATVAMCVDLLGINSTQWIVRGTNPETHAVNSTGVVIGTS
jgi:hypothetical protein